MASAAVCSSTAAMARMARRRRPARWSARAPRRPIRQIVGRQDRAHTGQGMARLVSRRRTRALRHGAQRRLREQHASARKSSA